MKIFVTAKPGAREESVEKIDEMNFRVSVKEPPLQGKANAAICRALASYLHITPSHVRITAGHTSRSKIVEIMHK